MELSQEILLKIQQFTPSAYTTTTINNENQAYQSSVQLSRPSNFNQNLQQISSEKQELSTDKSLEHFRSFFSPKDTAKSLQRRNDNLEMMRFENSDEEPDDVYNRRKKKASDLMDKQQEQIEIIQDIRRQSESKFSAIIQFVKFFCQLKDSLGGVRTDYYSNKTFCAIKNASQEQLRKATKVIERMYSNVMKASYNTETCSNLTGEKLNDNQQRKVQFLIIPRFLISKEKLNRLTRDEELQRNFQFLAANLCLGHYNNEANKKMPQEKQMKLVRDLLAKRMGRQKFKRICSINHGNKFFKSYGNAYYHLYSQSFQYLKHLQSNLKKGKKFETIKKDLQKFPLQTQETVGNSSCIENESSNNIYSFKSLGECLNKMQNQDEDMRQQMMDEPADILGFQPSSSMRKFNARKLMSLPIQQKQEENVNDTRKFEVRRFNTLQLKKTQNIILIPPPRHSQI